jgi:hypothetical protein
MRVHTQININGNGDDLKAIVNYSIDEMGPAFIQSLIPHIPTTPTRKCSKKPESDLTQATNMNALCISYNFSK